MPETWLTTQHFAAAEKVSVQAARSALKAALAGRSWRGRTLEVRVAGGRGGRRGLVYEVKTTLPETEPPACDLPRAATNAVATKRLELLFGLLDLPPGSQARAAAVAQAASLAGVSHRTLYRWLARYEANGLRGLGRTRPDNAGRPRIHVSRPFDLASNELGLSTDWLAATAAELKRTLRGLWASRAEQAGVSEIRRLAEFALQEICARHGVEMPASAFKLSRRYVEQFSAYRVINQRRNDRKAFDDAKPRIRRDWTDLAPMERIVADVKHLDVIVQRADGSPAWPKIIAFMDAGTGRVFVQPVLLERGEGVRQEHVIEAFLEMVAAPGWGFPQGLYLDNGGEFAALAKIDSALQLLNAAGARTIIYARPYNASAKPIESLFARLDRQVFCLLPGYAGPNRMAKKTQTVGKAPLPYLGDWEDFCRTLEGLIRAHNHRPVGGQRRGRSPEDWLKQKITEGWRAVHVEPSALDAAFSDADSRRLDRGVLKVNGTRYSHERLAAFPSRTVIDLALPWRRGAPPLAKVGGDWVYLEPEKAYPARWVEGARVSSGLQRKQARHVQALAKQAPVVDPVALKIRWGAQQENAVPAKPLQPLDLGGEPRAQAEGMRSRPVATPASTDAELRRAREMAITERLEKAQRSHG